MRSYSGIGELYTHVSELRDKPKLITRVCTPLPNDSCNDPSSLRVWQSIEQIKDAISQLFETGHTGIRVASIKAFQKIIQVQSKGGNPISKNDFNLRIVPPAHPFLNVPALEAEANRLLTQVVTLAFTSK
jgi:symplekin